MDAPTMLVASLVLCASALRQPASTVLPRRSHVVASDPST